MKTNRIRKEDVDKPVPINDALMHLEEEFANFRTLSFEVENFIEMALEDYCYISAKESAQKNVQEDIKNRSMLVELEIENLRKQNEEYMNIIKEIEDESVRDELIEKINLEEQKLIEKYSIVEKKRLSKMPPVWLKELLPHVYNNLSLPYTRNLLSGYLRKFIVDNGWAFLNYTDFDEMEVFVNQANTKMSMTKDHVEKVKDKMTQCTSTIPDTDHDQRHKLMESEYCDSNECNKCTMLSMDTVFDNDDKNVGLEFFVMPPDFDSFFYSKKKRPKYERLKPPKVFKKKKVHKRTLLPKLVKKDGEYVHVIQSSFDEEILKDLNP